MLFLWNGKYCKCNNIELYELFKVLCNFLSLCMDRTVFFLQNVFVFNTVPKCAMSMHGLNWFLVVNCVKYILKYITTFIVIWQMRMILIYWLILNPNLSIIVQIYNDCKNLKTQKFCQQNFVRSFVSKYFASKMIVHLIMKAFILDHNYKYLHSYTQLIVIIKIFYQIRRCSALV